MGKRRDPWDVQHATELLDALLHHERAHLVADATPHHDDTSRERAKSNIRRECIDVIAGILEHHRERTIAAVEQKLRARR